MAYSRGWDEVGCSTVGEFLLPGFQPAVAPSLCESHPPLDLWQERPRVGVCRAVPAST